MQPKHVARLSLAFLLIASAIVVVVIFWPMVAVTQTSTPTPGSQAEQVVKEKLENYGKRADDLQKLISVLVGFTTIYAIVLAISAYTTVQNNLQQADKAIDKLDKSVQKNLQDAEKAIAKLEKLREQHEKLIESSRDILPKELEQMRLTTTYFGRIALATAVSQFPVDEDDYKSVQESVINSLLELRNGQYSTDRVVNQQLARLYKALKRYRSAEEVMTSLIERKEKLGERDDETIVDAYYDRACYRCFQIAGASAEDKGRLVEAIKSDLTRVFTLDDSCRVYAQTDRWLQAVAGEDWFKAMVNA